MGIHGLSTFIQRYHDKYKEKVYLHHCPVVIDGCNLMFFLYFDWRQRMPTPTSTPTKKRTSNGKGSPLSKPSPLKQPHLFGGDYQFYAQNVRDFFQHLKLCSITPVVLFDGAYDALKIKTAFRRFADNLKQNVRQGGGGQNGLQGVIPGFSYSPVFMKAVFIEVLQEQKILAYQTEMEADCTIAYIARKLGNCPILSSDSDFHIYVNAVVLPLHTLKFKKVAPLKDKTKIKPAEDVGGDNGAKIWTLHSQYVSLSNLCCKEFNLQDLRLLPLAAVILGNDWIKTTTFSHFHSTTAGGSKVKRNSRIAYLLKWLGKQKSYHQILQTMLGTVRESQRERTAQLVNQIVSIYEGHGGEVRVWNMLLETGQVDKFVIDDTGSAESELIVGNMLDKLSLDETNLSLTTLTPSVEDEFGEFEDDGDQDEIESDSEDVTTDLEACENHTQLPDWYLDAHIKCSFPTYLLKLVHNQMVFLSPQAEVSSLPSTHTISIPIIRILAGLLLGPNKNVTLVSRHKSKITDIKVDTITELEHFGTLPVLSENCQEFKKSVSQESRAQIIFESLGLYTEDFVAFINQWPVSLRLWVIGLVYFLKFVHTNIINNEGNMSTVNSTSLPVAVSILLSVMKNSVLNPSGSSKKSSNVDVAKNSILPVTDSSVPKISDLLNQTDPATISRLRIFYAKFESVIDSTSRTFMKSYDITRTYNICRFTCLLFHLHQFNRILGDPFKAPRLNSSLNNWFAYNLSGTLLPDASTGIEHSSIGKSLEDLCGVHDIALVVEMVLKYV